MPRHLPPAPSNPKAELQDIDSFKVADIGRDVIVNGIGSGIVRFVGLDAANGEPLVGVEYNKPKGKHNGTLQGVHYFECDADKGTLASPSNVTFNDGSDRRSTMEAAPKKGWKAFSGNVASKMKGVSNVAGKMKGAIKKRATAAGGSSASPPLPNVPLQQQMNPLPLPPTLAPEADQGNVPSNESSTDGTDHATANEAYHEQAAEYQFATATPQDGSGRRDCVSEPPAAAWSPTVLGTPERRPGRFDGDPALVSARKKLEAGSITEVEYRQIASVHGIIKASNSVPPPLPAPPPVHQQPLANYQYNASAAPPPVHQQPLAYNASDVLPPMHQQSLERTLAGGGAVWAGQEMVALGLTPAPPVAPFVFVPPPAHSIDVRRDDCGLNGQGIKFGFYRSTVKGAQATVQKGLSLTGDKSGAATGEGGESILAIIRSTDGIGSTKKGGHVVEVRHADNGNHGATLSVSCCDGCCGGGDALSSGYQKGSETHKFSTAEIAYVKLNAVDEFDLIGSDDLGCCGNFCRKCFPSIYYCSQKWCGKLCGCCSPDGAFSDGTEKVLLRIGLQHADKEEIRIEYDKTNFTADIDDSDHPRCWCCDGKPCKPWKVRKTAVSKRMLADGTELRTSTWTEEEAPPTCCCFLCCYECDHNCCGVPRVTESFVTKEKYLMDAALKETYEVANNDMEGFASILSHLAAQATSFE